MRTDLTEKSFRFEEMSMVFQERSGISFYCRSQGCLRYVNPVVYPLGCEYCKDEEITKLGS